MMRQRKRRKSDKSFIPYTTNKVRELHGHSLTSSSIANIFSVAKKHFEGSDSLDERIVDQVVNYMYRGSTIEEQRKAHTLLLCLLHRHNTWTDLRTLLKKSKLTETKHLALQILENIILNGWKLMNDALKTVIKSVLIENMNNIVNITENIDKFLLNKYNLLLIQITKQESSDTRTQFLCDIVKACSMSEKTFVYNINFLCLISEEVFDFGHPKHTQAMMKHLRNDFLQQFEKLFDLCYDVLNDLSSPLMETALLALRRFLVWMPNRHIFNKGITDLLSEKIFPMAPFRVLALECLTDIAQIEIDPTKHSSFGYANQLKSMFRTLMLKVRHSLSAIPDLQTVFLEASNETPRSYEQLYITNLAHFLSNFLKKHLTLVELKMSKTVSPFLNDEYAYALELFVAFTIVDDFDLAKVCADFWCWFTSGLCREVPPQLFEMRIKLHANFLSRLRHVLIGIISQPHDVIFIDQLKVTEKAHGIDIIDLYYIRRETLIYLTRLDEQDMIHNIEEELKRQLGDGFCAVKLSKLCYAIGAISGVLPNDLERLLMGKVIYDLLLLYNLKHAESTETNTLLSIGLMHVFSQYPTFLSEEWPLLKKIVCKLIDFMRYINEELRHIACVTFLSIAMKCRCTFVIWHPTEPGPFLEYMLVNIKGITSKLTQYQHDIVYKAIGYMIMAQQDDSLQRKSLEQLLAIPNHLWREIVKTIQLKQSVLIDLQVLTFLQKVFKTNIAVCESLGTVFHTQIGLIYWDMLAIYRFLSENITKTVARSSLKALDCNIIKKSVETKREILALFSTFVRRCKNSPDFLSCIFPSLLGTVLFDYQENVASAKESLILTLITDIVTVMEPIFSNRVPSILDAILMPTLQIILEDKMVFPEHFLCYFRLLLVLITKWCPIVLQIPDIQLKLTVDSIQWAIQNSLRDIGKIGLDTLKALMIMAAKSPDHVAQPFFRKYYMCIIEHLLAVVMNNNQIYIVGFEPYAEIFCVLFQICEDSITVPLNDYNSSQSNTEFVFSHIGSCLHRHYDNMTLDQIRLITKGFLNFNADPIRMKGHLKDLLVHIRIHHANDPSDLYLNELETEIMVDEERKRAIADVVKFYESHE